MQEAKQAHFPINLLSIVNVDHSVSKEVFFSFLIFSVDYKSWSYPSFGTLFFYVLFDAFCGCHYVNILIHKVRRV